MSLLAGEVTWLDTGRGLPTLPVPLSLRVISAEYGHEVAQISYPYDAEFAGWLYRGAPVRIVYGNSRGHATFVGTHHHATVDRAADAPQPFLRVVCVGATDALNAPAATNYRSIRVDALIGELARSNGYSSLIEEHNYIWRSLPQPGDSTWKFMVAMAQRIGWTLYPRATDIRCHSRAVRTDSARVFTNYGQESPNRPYGLIAFQVVHGETLDVGETKRQRTALGADPTGNVYINATGQQRNLSGPVATGSDLARRVNVFAADAAESGAYLAGQQEMNRHYITAEATLTGWARLHAASTVRLQQLDTRYDGCWYITRAEHSVTTTMYRTVVTIGRDSFGDIPDASARPVAHDGLRAGTPAAEQYPGPIWTDRWRASAPVTRSMPPILRPVPVSA